MGDFSTDVRAFTCPHCGAPLHVSPAGGEMDCGYCRASLSVAPRFDAPTDGPRPTEEERMQGLWAQAATSASTLAPPEMLRLLGAGPLTADRIGPALSLWQAYCDRAKAGDSAYGEYALILTGSINTYYFKQGDLGRQRAVLETAMDALPRPWQKAVMRCRLARAALAAGEMDAALAWFESCDPAPLELWADTDYRWTAASLAAHDGDFEEVLSVLGSTREAIPIAMPAVVGIDAIRANALERTGQMEAAVEQLVQLCRAVPAAVAALPLFVAGSDIEMCPQGLPLALELVRGGATTPPAGQA